MPNKRIIPVVAFFFMCVPVFSQTGTDNFIEGFYWYWKYLPQEHISEYYALENALAYLKENDTPAFEKLSADLSEPIRYLNDRVHENLHEERRRVSPKIKILVERYGSNTEVIALAEQFTEFEDALARGIFPPDDSCLAKIDGLYSRLITRLGYVFLNDRTYLVKKGDYLRKIAATVYENELLWESIYNENKNDGNFLPDPRNPDLIYPEARIQIPPKPE